MKRGTTIANVRAVDVDSGKYGTGGIRYTELRGQLASMLSLDPITGVIRTGSKDDDNELKEELETFFDREKLDFHYLTVEARDDVGKGNRNTVELLIYVTDVNDNPPVFESKQYEAYLTEVISIFQPIFETPITLKTNILITNKKCNLITELFGIPRRGLYGVCFR